MRTKGSGRRGVGEFNYIPVFELHTINGSVPRSEYAQSIIAIVATAMVATE